MIKKIFLAYLVIIVNAPSLMIHYVINKSFDILGLILAQEDTDGDFQITVSDTGPKSFALGTASSGGYRKYDIRGTYMLSNLLQELALANDYGRKHIILDEERLNENPVDRMCRLIKYHFWDGLTRRIDADGKLN